MSLNCTLRNDEDGTFCYVLFYRSFKRRESALASSAKGNKQCTERDAGVKLMLPPTNERVLSQKGPRATSQSPSKNPPPSDGSEVQPGLPGSFPPGVQSCKGQRCGDSGDVEPDAGAEEGPWRKAFRGWSWPAEVTRS